MAFKDKIKQILSINDTPRRIAMAFALGVFMAITPLFGLHAIGTLFLAWLFRLNKLVAIAGAAILNPWTVVPICSFSLWVGAKMMGMKQILPEIDWTNVTLAYLIKKLSHLILPLLIGSVSIGIVSAVISYFIMYNVVSKYRAVKHEEQKPD